MVFLRQMWEHVSLRKLASRVLSFAAEKASLTGPDVRLRPKLAIDLSIILHELLTNALKYGSLSVGEGRVSVEWSSDPSGKLTLHWLEMDGPIVRPPNRTGLGSALIHNVLTEDDGRVEVKFAPTGLSCSVSFMNNSQIGEAAGREYKLGPLRAGLSGSALPRPNRQSSQNNIDLQGGTGIGPASFSQLGNSSMRSRAKRCLMKACLLVGDRL
jgi:hypothetical protein